LETKTLWESPNGKWKIIQDAEPGVILVDCRRGREIQERWTVREAAAMTTYLPQYVKDELVKYLPSIDEIMPDEEPASESPEPPAAEPADDDIDPRLLPLRDLKDRMFGDAPPQDTGIVEETLSETTPPPPPPHEQFVGYAQMDVEVTHQMSESFREASRIHEPEEPMPDFTITENIMQIDPFRVKVEIKGKWKKGTVVGAYMNKPWHPYLYHTYHIIFDDGVRDSIPARSCYRIYDQPFRREAVSSKGGAIDPNLHCFIDGVRTRIANIPDRSLTVSDYRETLANTQGFKELIPKLSTPALLYAVRNILENCRYESDATYDGILKSGYVPELIRRLEEVTE